jgi:hypothetical protein
MYKEFSTLFLTHDIFTLRTHPWTPCQISPKSRSLRLRAANLSSRQRRFQSKT